MAAQKQLLDGLAQIPGVTAVSAATIYRLAMFARLDSGWNMPPPDDYHWAQNSLVSPGYFRTMGISLLQGRDFTEQRPSFYRSNVAIVSEALAREYFPGQNRVGQRFQWGGLALFTIIGVAARCADFRARRRPVSDDLSIDVPGG